MPLKQLSSSAIVGNLGGHGSVRAAAQTHHFHGMKPGLWGLCEGAEFLLTGINSGDIKSREVQRPSESPVPATQPRCGLFWRWGSWPTRGGDLGAGP